MSQRRIRVHPAAVREFRVAADRYDNEVPGLGDRFGDNVEATLDTLREYPHTGAPHLFGTRRILVVDFPYSIVYRPGPGDGLDVVAVPHHRRRPGYWKNRRF